MIRDRPTIVQTVLGSCVSVTLFHRLMGLGAICHGVLPHGECEAKYKYVDCSIRWMLRKFDAYGIPRDEIEVKLFGGSDLFRAGGEKMSGVPVGEQNIEVARRILRAENVFLLASDVGGSHGRKLFFNTRTGEVLLSHLRETGEPSFFFNV